MRIAIPIFRSRISPVFDFSTQVLIVDADKGKDAGRKESALLGLGPCERGKLLKDEDVNLLICAGVSISLHRMIINEGIRIIPGIVGEVDDVIDAYRTEGLKEKRFLMPGCCRCRRRKRFRMGHI